MKPVSEPAARIYRMDERVKTLLDAALERDIRVVEIHGSTLYIPLELRFGNIESVQTYIDLTLGKDEIIQRYPKAEIPLQVHAMRDNKEPYYRQNKIGLPDHGGGISPAMREIVVLHEMAHHLGSSGHSQRFLDAYIDLVEKNMSPSLGLYMRMIYEES